MDATAAIKRKLDSALEAHNNDKRWIADCEREIVLRRSGMAVNEGIVEALQSLLNEIGEPDTGVAVADRDLLENTTEATDVPEKEVTGRDIRDRFVAFLQSEPEEFTTDQIVKHIREEFPTVNRMIVSNALSYEKRTERIDHINEGLYRYPMRNGKAYYNTAPNLIDQPNERSEKTLDEFNAQSD